MVRIESSEFKNKPVIEQKIELQDIIERIDKELENVNFKRSMIMKYRLKLQKEFLA